MTLENPSLLMNVAFSLDAENKPTVSPEPCEIASNKVPIKADERWSSDFECQTSMRNSESDLSDTSDKGFSEQEGNLLATNHPNNSCDWKKEQTFLRLIRGYESEEDVEEPEGKRRCSVPCSIPSSADKQALVSPCLPIPETLPLNHWEYNSQDTQCLKSMHPAREESVFSVSQMSETDFRAQLPLGERTSTQSRHPCPLRSPAKHSGKENCPSVTTKWKDLGWNRSPQKNRPRSPSHLAAKSRPWEPRCQSPQRSVLRGARKELETDSMASLFTQDSQGFRVIAHRNHQSWSPLKDRTNNGSPGGGWEASVGSPDRDSDQELEAEMLFTQDSQGNLVIKH